MSRRWQILGLLCVSIGAGCSDSTALDDYLAKRDADAGPAGDEGAAGAMPPGVTTPVTSPMVPRTASGVPAAPPPVVPMGPSTPPPTTPPPATPPPTTPPPATPPPATPPPATPPPTTPATDPCAALKSCCAMLDDEDAQGECDEVASDADVAACTEAIPDTCASTPPTVPPGADTCSALETCCAQLDEDDQEACDDVASGADAAECGDALADLCPDDATTPRDPGARSCRRLRACCADLDDEDDQEECGDVVADADSDACAEASADFCS